MSKIRENVSGNPRELLTCVGGLPGAAEEDGDVRRGEGLQQPTRRYSRGTW